MKTMLLALALVAVTAGLLAPDVRGGDDDVAAGGAWTFEVRVVRVDTPTPEVTETAPSWASGGPVISTPWPRLLEQLKARGETTLLLDQGVTSLAGGEAYVSQTRDRLIKQYTNSDFNNERWASAPIVTGSSAKLRSTPEGHLTYDLEARWFTPVEKPNWRPLLSSAKWRGTVPALDGATLAVSYREQVTVGGGRRGVEIHVFVTGRRLR